MSEILKTAREVLAIEAEGISKLIDRLDGGFEAAVHLILDSPGKVITTGIGKSGIVARKIMATLNSTGTTSIFLHPVEALHGDLGMVGEDDVVLALSHSGRTEELVHLVPQLKGHGAKVVAMTGGLDSPLAAVCDVVIDCGVEREACPLGLAPTASTTAALAVGDALAVVLIEKQRFSAEKFAFNHPGGNLGHRLSLMVAEVMTGGDDVPAIEPGTGLADALSIMDKGDLGTLLIVKSGKLLGIFTDGDLRRALVRGVDLEGIGLEEIMTVDPAVVSPHATAADALQMMEEMEITVLPVVSSGVLKGVVHLHDLLGRGQVSFRGLSTTPADRE